MLSVFDPQAGRNIQAAKARNASTKMFFFIVLSFKIFVFDKTKVAVCTLKEPWAILKIGLKSQEKLSVNAVPSPSRLLTVKWMPSKIASFFAIDSPNPAPGTVELRESSVR